MDELIVKSKAKINIGLNIINKRPDGFHNIETIFYPINLFDEIRFTKSDLFSFSSNDDILIKEKTNLIIKSKEVLENYLGLQLTPKIYLDKNIPIGAGLGGGSSNAASSLIALIKLYNIKIESSTLTEIALKLGSDVTFFFNPVPSFAESRGEVLTPIDLKLDKYLLLVNPGIHISTKWAFNKITPKKSTKNLKSLDNNYEIKFDDLRSAANNDFEEIVFNHYPAIRMIKEDMIQFGCDFTMMTGTGSTVWAMFEAKETAYKAESYFKSKNYFTFVQKTI
jgi:4-diphosphocytidyl-2-C-methyl-D-erythritol kinase